MKTENEIIQQQTERLQQLAREYTHIKGWGIDADPANHPAYPMRQATDDLHSHVRPTQQLTSVEILKSNERPTLPAVFGTAHPPTGISGNIRRWAFRYSEDSLKHWVGLILADRVNVMEALVADFRKGILPNLIAEKGWKSEWKYNKKGVIKKAAVAAAVVTVLILLLKQRRKKRMAF